jgi:bacteriocin-like protein
MKTEKKTLKLNKTVVQKLTDHQLSQIQGGQVMISLGRFLETISISRPDVGQNA